MVGNYKLTLHQHLVVVGKLPDIENKIVLNSAILTLLVISVFTYYVTMLKKQTKYLLNTYIAYYIYLLLRTLYIFKYLVEQFNTM